MYDCIFHDDSDVFDISKGVDTEEFKSHSSYSKISPSIQSRATDDAFSANMFKPAIAEGAILANKSLQGFQVTDESASDSHETVLSSMGKVTLHARNLTYA
jgi:hypothetical protein